LEAAAIEGEYTSGATATRLASAPTANAAANVAVMSR
jgi:hypothetical protein